MMICLLMSKLRYPDTIKKYVNIYIKCEQRVTGKHFHQVRSKSEDWKAKLRFLLAIVLSVLLRHTDSDCPFGIFKLFLIKSL
jgi:hypothetical protein